MKRNPPERLCTGRRSNLFGPFLQVLLLLCLIIIGIAIVRPLTNPRIVAARATNQKVSSEVAQTISPDGEWINLKSGAQTQQHRADIRAFRAVALDRAVLASILSAAPMEFSNAAARRRTILTLPNPDGSFAHFSIAESPIMAPELAARFPEIKTYVGQGIDDPTATTRFDWTPQGFHAIVLSAEGTVLIEPDNNPTVENYIVYFQKDVVVGPVECDVTDHDQEEAIARLSSDKHAIQYRPAVFSGTTLNTYRLAVAATAEYTQTYGGGSVNGALAAITTTINLVDAIYEREAAIRLTLIADETSIIFTNSATDGYTSDNASAMFNENQTKLDSVIGSTNYDVGHVFDGRTQSGGFSWQGVASIGSVCLDGAKARGVDIFRSIGPANLYAYYSASHELGHQFGATHTFNANTGLCGVQRTASTAYEPASGSTIMAYRLACSPDDLNSTDTYFHNNSIEQIVNFTTAGNGGTCATPLPTGNNPPFVDAGKSYTIPIGTPFTLTASGADPDGDALTFCWEEFDLGAAAPPETDDGSRPIFRSFAPTTNPLRTFPRLQDILSSLSTLGESLPFTTRTMNFRVTARDNRAGGGGINSAATRVTSQADAGPFRVTQPEVGTTWAAGTSQTVTWDVANTSDSPVSCTKVKITLSTDGGLTFPIILANETANDGSEVVTIPGTPTFNARVKVEAVGNIFFNISRSFTITGAMNSAPTVTGFSPASGSAGTVVTINGANFISPSAVNFNGVGASFEVNSTTQIIATVPNGATTGPITVVTSSGIAVSPDNFVVTMPTVQFSASSYQVSESGLDAEITVTRTGDISAATTIHYATSDNAGANNCNLVNSAASSRCDYINSFGTLQFAANETSKTISIPIIDDSYAEGPETFSISLSDPINATLGSPATATITIVDNETVNGPNPIDMTGFLVRQHYLDFLNREPDPPGLAFWTNQITSCGADLACSEIKRLNVSASFFLSIEFQQTGYLVERMYKAAYGDTMGASTIGGMHQLPVPMVRFNEFLPDVQRIGQGVIVGQPGWEAVLESNKQAFASEFVQRSRFITAYPSSMTSVEFVDAVSANAGVPLSGSKRNQLVYDFTSGAKTRAQVLRAIAEDQDLYNAEFNRAFVLMQYFGYLRRNPNEGQDTDYSGYDFWLTKLNFFNGNFISAEMVKAFITSIEYRQRFGP